MHIDMEGCERPIRRPFLAASGLVPPPDGSDGQRTNPLRPVILPPDVSSTDQGSQLAVQGFVQQRLCRHPRCSHPRHGEKGRRCEPVVGDAADVRAAEDTDQAEVGERRGAELGEERREQIASPLDGFDEHRTGTPDARGVVQGVQGGLEASFEDR